MSSPSSEAPTPTPTPQAESSKATLFQKVSSSFTILFILVWAVGGIAAIIMSLVCFGFSGSTAEKAIGLALAFFLGPLYFIFYAVNKNYCRSMVTTVTSGVNRMMGGAAAVAAAVNTIASVPSE